MSEHIFLKSEYLGISKGSFTFEISGKVVILTFYVFKHFV